MFCFKIFWPQHVNPGFARLLNAQYQLVSSLHQAPILCVSCTHHWLTREYLWMSYTKCRAENRGSSLPLPVEAPFLLAATSPTVFLLNRLWSICGIQAIYKPSYHPVLQSLKRKPSSLQRLCARTRGKRWFPSSYPYTVATRTGPHRHTVLLFLDIMHALAQSVLRNMPR